MVKSATRSLNIGHSMAKTNSDIPMIISAFCHFFSLGWMSQRSRFLRGACVQVFDWKFCLERALTWLPSLVQVGLKDVHISVALMEEFMRYASQNTRKGIESCGILAGKLDGNTNTFTITTLIIPHQVCCIL